MKSTFTDKELIKLKFISKASEKNTIDISPLDYTKREEKNKIGTFLIRKIRIVAEPWRKNSSYYLHVNLGKGLQVATPFCNATATYTNGSPHRSNMRTEVNRFYSSILELVVNVFIKKDIQLLLNEKQKDSLLNGSTYCLFPNAEELSFTTPNIIISSFIGTYKGIPRFMFRPKFYYAAAFQNFNKDVKLGQRTDSVEPFDTSSLKWGSGSARLTEEFLPLFHCNLGILMTILEDFSTHIYQFVAENE